MSEFDSVTFPGMRFFGSPIVKMWTAAMQAKPEHGDGLTTVRESKRELATRMMSSRP